MANIACGGFGILAAVGFERHGEDTFCPMTARQVEDTGRTTSSLLEHNWNILIGIGLGYRWVTGPVAGNKSAVGSPLELLFILSRQN